MKKRVLISTFDKTGLIEFANFLVNVNYEIISTYGTFLFLKKHGLNPIKIDNISGFPEIISGRVKTFHPNIYAGILARRDNINDIKTLKKYNINFIDMVIVNFYPCLEKKQNSIQEKFEHIDIGGPSLLRAAAKNFFHVSVITDMSDCIKVKEEIKKFGNTSFSLRKKLAAKVFNIVSAYDSVIYNSFLEEKFPPYLNFSYKKKMNLRYGENPHQKSAYYVNNYKKGHMCNFDQINGKILSFNNLLDINAACNILSEFKEPTCCIVKHSTPCGVASSKNINNSYEKAYACDPISIYGGILSVNRKLTEFIAEKISKIFLDIVIAPNFESKALKILTRKKKLCLIKINNYSYYDRIEYVKVDGGMLVQEYNKDLILNFKNVTKKKVTKEQYNSLIFAQKVVKYVKSNAIVISKGLQTIGICGGQTNRIFAVKQAIKYTLKKYKNDLVLASDAFFPFRDVVDEVARNGIKAIIQPGGSIRDLDSIKACDENNISMIFTGIRHFKH